MNKFKIDLIVWKFAEWDIEMHLKSVFKIDLIVWKLDLSCVEFFIVFRLK